MTAPRRRCWVAWSSGKDSALALHEARRDPGLEVVGLLTTTDRTADAVTMHGVPTGLVEAQARALGLPLEVVALPQPCPDDEYGRRMAEALGRARAQDVEMVVFGDLHLADVRAYREASMRASGLEPVFPLWGRPPAETARRIVDAGIEAVVVCVDGDRLDPALVGRRYDHDLLADLPDDVDPCGENGELHTFVVDGPDFARPVPVRPGAVTNDGRFARVDLAPDPGPG